MIKVIGNFASCIIGFR